MPRSHRPRPRGTGVAAVLACLLTAGTAGAEGKPEGTRVLGVRAGSACVREQVRITGFALAREESGGTIPFEGYRVTEILAGEGDTVTSGQEILRAVRQGGGPGPQAAQAASPGAQAGQPPGPPDPFSLRAPIAGRITRLAARVGLVTGPPAPASAAGFPEPMLRIMADAGIDLLVDVPSPYAAKLRAGTAARVIPDEGPEVRGSVRTPVSEVDPRTQLGRTRLAIDPPNALRPGQFASAVIETARACGVSVPRAAVSYQAGKPVVQVLDGNAVTTRGVRVGLADDTHVQILEGLSAGEPVVANAGTALRPGDRVAPVITGQVGAMR